ncbi:hypothetical protein LguiA_004263 [Lonicera macranthoides]
MITDRCHSLLEHHGQHCVVARKGGCSRGRSQMGSLALRDRVVLEDPLIYNNRQFSHGSVLSFSDQLELFKEYIEKLKGVVGEEETKTILSESVYLVSAVTNDLVFTYFSIGLKSLRFNYSTYTDFLAASASQFLQEIYKLGARKMGILGAPPIGCLPFQRTMAGGPFRRCSEDQNQAAKLYNSKLSSQLDSLNANLPQARVVYTDIYNPLNHLIKNPTKYASTRFYEATSTISCFTICNVLKYES